MSDPGSVVPVFGFTTFISANLFKGFLVGLRVVFDRNLRGHAAHGMDAAAMAGLDQELGIRL